MCHSPTPMQGDLHCLGLLLSKGVCGGAVFRALTGTSANAPSTGASRTGQGSAEDGVLCEHSSWGCLRPSSSPWRLLVLELDSLSHWGRMHQMHCGRLRLSQAEHLQTSWRRSSCSSLGKPGRALLASTRPLAFTGHSSPSPQPGLPSPQPAPPPEAPLSLPVAVKEERACAGH